MNPSCDNRPPKHLRTLKAGDRRADGMVFHSYNRALKSGEQWVSPEKFAAYRAQQGGSKVLRGDLESAVISAVRCREQIFTRMKLKDIAEICGTSKQRIEQIEKRALRKIRMAISSEGALRGVSKDDILSLMKDTRVTGIPAKSH